MIETDCLADVLQAVGFDVKPEWHAPIPGDMMSH